MISYVENNSRAPQNADTDDQHKIPQDRVHQWLCLTLGLSIVKVWELSLGLLVRPLVLLRELMKVFHFLSRKNKSFCDKNLGDNRFLLFTATVAVNS